MTLLVKCVDIVTARTVIDFDQPNCIMTGLCIY